MKSVHSYRSTVLLCVTIISFVIVGAGSVNADFALDLPVNLGPMVNTAYEDSVPSISSDGLSLCLESNRPGGIGAADIWVSTRAHTSDAWGQPVNLGPTVNSSALDCQPDLSADGLSLYFRSDRPGSIGYRDLWVTRRETVGDPWGQPVWLCSDLGPGVSVSSDGLSFYFAAGQPADIDDVDIWFSTGANVADAWAGATSLGSTVNSASEDAQPSISAEGLALFFSSQRPEGYGGRDVWLTTRSTANATWGKPVNLGPMVNSAYHDGSPSISADGATLYFDSLRPGGFGGHDMWQASITPVVDFDGDEAVNFRDFSKFAQCWRGSGLSVDIGPSPLGDGVVDFRDLAVLTAYWLADASPPVYIQWFGHASVKIWAKDIVVYIDPRNLPDAPHDATIVCVTHSHSDHYAPADIGKVWKADTVFAGPPDVVAAYGRGQVLAPGQTLTWPDLSITGVPAYNINKTNHPKANNWLGFIVEIASKRVYVAGDTDLTPEMKALQGIDVAILPAGGSYTMDAIEAAEATQYLQPQLAIPYHWGEIVGTLKDAQQFARLAACSVKIMAKGEVLSSRDWEKDFSLVAHWPLDEQEGDIATDVADSAAGTLHGTPLWQPAGGMIGGAVQLDGLESYVSTPFVLDPADGAFSAFAWVKGGAPGQVIVSQAGGDDWLMADPSAGRLMTTLQKPRGRSPVPPLVSEAVITDGQWHRVGLVWDGTDRILYVDDLEAARDTQAAPAGLTEGLYLGCGKDRTPGTFFSSLIDDVRVYNRAVKP